MKETLYKIFGIIILLALFIFATQYFEPSGRGWPDNKTVPSYNLLVGTKEIKAEFARTAEERNKGLSGRKALEPDNGLLFMFEEPGKYGFWMKDMNFPIDIIWISETKKVLSCEREVEPDSYPLVYYPPASAQFVLEVPAGFCESQLISGGETVSW